MRTACFLVLCFTTATAVAQEERAPKSAVAKRAKSTYEAEVKKLTKGYEAAVKRYDEILEKELAKAKGKYIEQLDFARKNALIKDDLDEAQRLAKAKKALAEGVKEEPSAEKPDTPKQEHWLVGTIWVRPDGGECHWGNGTYKGWDKGALELVGRWLPAGENKVILFYQGPDEKRWSWVQAWEFTLDRKSARAMRYKYDSAQNYTRNK